MTGERQAAGTLAVPAALLLLVGLSATGAHAERAAGVKRSTPAVVAQVISVQGQTVSTPRPAAVTGRRQKGQPTSTTQPALLQAGGELVEGARIQVPEDGYLRLQLADGTVLRVLASSDVELRRLRRRVPSGPIDAVLDVRRGKVEAEVAPKQPGRVFEIHAPGAVASVRGTRFDVAVTPDGRVATAVTEGAVGLRSRPPNRRIAARSTRLAAGQGVVVGADGRLGTRQTLLPAPELGALPTDYEDADRLVIDLGTVEPRAASYEVRVALDADLQQVVRNGIFVEPRVQFAALSDGPYTVGVRALDASGLAGLESRRAIRVNARPVPPLYQSPPPGGRITSEAGQLMCSQTAGAEWVHLQVSSRADFSAPEIDQPRLTQCRLGVTALPPGDYQWRVASVSTGEGGVVDHGPFAAPQRFSVVTSPTIAGLAVPDQGEAPTLSWEGASGVTFRGQLARDEAFTDVLADVELDRPAWTLSGLARGTYYVRLQARDASGLSGAFSPPRRVRIGGVVQTGNGSTLTSTDNEPVGRP